MKENTHVIEYRMYSVE